MGSTRKQRQRMFDEDPHCRDCGILMWMTPPKTPKNMTKEQIDTIATIGHKYSRYDIRRQTEPDENKKHRLICHKCNQQETKEEEARLPEGELQKRSRKCLIKSDLVE